MIRTIKLDKNSKFEASYTTFYICGNGVNREF